MAEIKATSESSWAEGGWLLVARICLVGVSVLLAALHTFYGGEFSTPPERAALLVIGILFTINLGSHLVFRSRSCTRYIGHTQFILDALIISGVIYITGGSISPFVSLYLPLVMVAAIMSSRRFALILSGICSAVYGGLIWGLMVGMLPAPDGVVRSAILGTGVPLQIVGLCSGMFLVSVATSFLVRRVSLSVNIAEQSKRDLDELTSRQRSLMNEVPDGIVTTHLDDSLVSLNQAASELLRVSESEVVGKSLSQIVSKIATNFDSGRGVKNREVHLEPKDPEDEVRLSFLERPVFNGEGLQTGNVFIFRDVTKLRSIEEQLAMQERMARLLSDTGYDQGIFHTKVREFVGESPIMQQVFKLISRVAPSDATTLICGESGTGKELVAKAIHLGSPRAHGRFVTVNCGAIPENLIESELFGHKKGSFTGAVSDHPGLFQEADGGTIFLDEIGELPLQMQAKLLRALQEKTIRAVGGNRDVSIDCRIIAATNRNLRKEVELGNFREDLFFRLNVIMIQLPALRDRKEDLPYLINSILKGLIKNKPMPIVPAATMQLLGEYNYPGNVRELENLLERALVLGGEAILPEHLPESVITYKERVIRSPRPETQIHIDESIEFPVRLDDILQDVERKYLEVALVKTNGAKKKAADLLGINFRSFRYRLQKFGISDE